MKKKVFSFLLKKIYKKNLYIYQKNVFNIKRFYFHNNLKKGYTFGVHAHKYSSQIFICIHGSFKFSLLLNNKKKIYILDNPLKALYIGSGIYKKIETISKNSILCSFSNKKFNKNDYIYK
jgi:quercetin dioxygenase-like cupin family protein